MTINDYMTDKFD
jgi:hypothetical protein